MSLTRVARPLRLLVLEPRFTEVNEYFFENLSSEILVYVAAAISAAGPAMSDFRSEIYESSKVDAIDFYFYAFGNSAVRTVGTQAGVVFRILESSSAGLAGYEQFDRHIRFGLLQQPRDNARLQQRGERVSSRQFRIDRKLLV